MEQLLTSPLPRLASGFAFTGVGFLDGFGGKLPPSSRADEDSGLLLY